MVPCTSVQGALSDDPAFRITWPELGWNKFVEWRQSTSIYLRLLGNHRRSYPMKLIKRMLIAYPISMCKTIMKARSDYMWNVKHEKHWYYRKGLCKDCERGFGFETVPLIFRNINAEGRYLKRKIVQMVPGLFENMQSPFGMNEYTDVSGPNTFHCYYKLEILILEIVLEG